MLSYLIYIYRLVTDIPATTGATFGEWSKLQKCTHIYRYSRSLFKFNKQIDDRTINT